MQIASRPIRLSAPRPQAGSVRPTTAAARPVAAAAPALDTRAYQSAVERIRGFLSREDRLKAGTDPSGLRLQPNYDSIFMPQPRPSAKGTVVLYHGFTAGPWQYEELAQKFYAAGYNVYAPRIVGHGLMTADGKVSTRELPRAHEREQYLTYLDERFEEAKALGGPVFMVGLSGGGNLALATAERHPEVKRVVAFAPYLGPGNFWRYGTWLLSKLDKVTFGGLSWALGAIPFAKNKRPTIDDVTPHTNGSLGQAWAIRSIGYRLGSIPVPTQFFTTEGDFLSGARHVEKLIQRSGGDDQNGWYHFGAEAKVPHAMVSRAENPAPGAVDLLNESAFAFVEQAKQNDHWPQ